MTTATFVASDAPPAEALRLRHRLMRWISRRLRQVIVLLDSLEYAIDADEAVLGVVESGHCWVVRGRHGATLVSNNLPIWDVDVIAGLGGDTSDSDALSRLEALLLGESETERFRIYRTRNGWRVICTTRPVDLNSADGWAWFARVGDALGADPIYMKLCRKQHTCRARLLPKAGAEPGCRACRLVGVVGRDLRSEGVHSHEHPDLRNQLQSHDGSTRATGNSDPLG